MGSAAACSCRLFAAVPPTLAHTPCCSCPAHLHLPAPTPPLCCSLLSEAGGTPLPPGAEHSIDQQPGGRYFRMLQACLLADVAQRFGKAARWELPCRLFASVGKVLVPGRTCGLVPAN